MKKTIIIAFLGFFLFGYNVSLKAQNYTAKNGKVVKTGEYVWADFEVEAGSSISSPSIVLIGSSIKKLAKFLTKNESKIQNWAQTAQQEGVKDFKKLIDDVRIYIDSFSGWYNSKSLYRIYLHTDQALFCVNDKGDCYIKITCDVGKDEITNNKVLSTTSVTSTVLNAPIAVGNSTTREKEIVYVGKVGLCIPAKEIATFVNHLNELLIEMKEAKKANKSTDKLFK